MKWYKHDPDAFIAGTAELTLEEIGAYSLILNILYSRNGKVPDDDRFICRNLRCNPRTWRKIKASLVTKGKIRLIGSEFGSNWTANRVEFTLNEARTFTEIQSNRAKKRWKTTAEACQDGNAKTTTTTTTLPPTPLNEKPATEEAFDRFKAAYPKRLGSPAWNAARKAFVAAVKAGTDPEAIIAAARRYASAPGTKVGTEFVAMATTWLHQKRWEDYPPSGNGADERSEFSSHWEHVKAKMREFR